MPFPIALLCCELLFGQPVVANSSSAIVDAVCLPLMRTLGYGVQRNRDRV